MLRYWRIWLLIVIVLGAMLSIGLKAYPYGRNGVEVIYMSDISPAKGFLDQGMIITELNGIEIKNINEWNTQTKNLSGEISLKANGKDYNFVVNETLGIDVIDISRTNLELGLDLRGGTRIILKPKENVTSDIVAQTISTLQTRANIYGLKEMKFYDVRDASGNYYIQIEAAGVGRDVVDNLLSRQGNFEAKILKPANIENNEAVLQLGDSSYTITILDNDKISVSDSIISINDSFELNGINFEYVNRTNKELIFLAIVYSGNDIELVYSDPQRSGIIQQQNGVLFYFVVLVSQDGAKRFADVTAGIPRYFDLQSGEEYLDTKILLYLDDQLVSDLRISASLAGQVYTTPQIQGFRSTMEDATNEKMNLQTILRSGALPVTLETASIDVISPTLGTGFFTSAAYAGLFAGIVVFVIVFIRYRSIRVALPLVFIAFSEVIIILGIAATNDSMIWSVVLLINFILISAAWWKKHDIDVYVWAGAILIPLLGMMSWTIDLPAIGGIIAAIGTGVDHQIIIADEAITGERKKEYDIKEKIKRAFFIIFGAAATTIAAMVPLMFLGIGLVRGFAITTIIGVLVGILITRPAYAKIVESIAKAKK